MTLPPIFRAIIIDPPWRYDSPKALVGCIKKDGTPSIQVDVESQYQTMSLEELKALRVPAARDCLLFMWVTNPFLCDGSGPEVVKSWGFTPKTVLTWAKVKADGETPSMKTGHWFRSASEHVIVGLRGNMPRPAGFPALPTWFPQGRLPHSVKPDVLYEWVERAVPEGPWLEMFARRKRDNWWRWGAEAPELTADEIL